MKKEELVIINKHIKTFVAANYSRAATAQYGISFAKEFYKCGNTSCHAGLRLYEGNVRKPIAVISQLQRFCVDNDVAKRYIEWLLNYSPFRHVFVTKSVRSALSKFVVVADASQPANLMVGGLISTRYVSESYLWPCAKVWDKLVHYGLHPNAAFAIANALGSSGNQITRAGSSHGTFYYPLHSVIENENIEKQMSQIFWSFLQDKPNKKNLMHPFAETKNYDAIQSLWEAPTKLPMIGMVVEQCLQSVIKEHKAGKNPFDKPGNVKHMPIDEASEEIAMQINNVIKKAKVNLAA